MNKDMCYYLLLAALALGSGRPAAAQTRQKVYTYVEQMPELPGGGGLGAVQVAIMKNFRYPADALRANLRGTIYLRFNVTETGRVAEAQVIKGLSASADAAALDALRRLPTFRPGKQNGQAVTVSFTIPLTLMRPEDVPRSVTVTVRGEQGNLDLSELSGEGRDPAVGEVVENKVYTFVEQMPELPGSGGTQAIVAALRQRLLVPADAQEGRVFTSFVVGPQGKVSDARIVKGLNASTDAAVLAAVRQLPTFVPGKQNGRAVAVSFTIPVSVFLPNHVFEVRQVATRARFAQPGLFAYLQRNLRVPAVVASEKLRGLVGVDFVVLASGQLANPTLTSRVCSSCDAEVLRLVQSLPPWLPARDHAGRAVAVRQHLDVPLPLPDPSAPYTRPEKPYTYVAVFPTLLDGTPTSDLGALLTQTIRYPEAARREKIVGNAQVEFIVAADGTVHDARVTQPVCSSCDQAILDAVAALGPLLPGRQASEPVPVLLQITVPFAPGAAPTPAKK